MQLTPLPLPDRSEDDSALSPAERAMIRKCNQKMEALNAKLQHSPRSRVPTAEEPNEQAEKGYVQTAGGSGGGSGNGYPGDAAKAAS